jgi:uncharacterized protein (DUF1015 family)
MPELRPFRGIRYARAVELEALVCPPYDVISPEEQTRLYERHPNNAVRVELPFSEQPNEAEEERYRRAAHHFRAWLAEGILEEDRAPSLYVYRQDFVASSGARRRLAGVVGALRLEPLGAGDVLPHEKTMPGPVEDRLRLLRACPVNISPIYGIYAGGGGLAPYLDSLAARPPAARFTDDNGTLHRLWVVQARAEVEMLAGALEGGPLVVADGHHRYETALAYHREQGGGPEAHAAVMCYCVDADAEDLEVHPYHRAFDVETPAEAIERRLLEAFRAKSLTSGEGLSALERSSADHPLLFVLPHRDVLVEVGAEEVDRRVGDRPPALRRLDVVALHEVVIPEVFPEGLRQLVFSSDAGLVLSLVRARGRSGGVILRGLNPAQVMKVALSGARMPQKASYFWPKALTGLVFRALSEEVRAQP